MDWSKFTPEPNQERDWSTFSDWSKFEAEKPVEGGFMASAKQAIGAGIRGAGQVAADFIPGVGSDNALKRYGQEVIDANPTAVRSFGDIGSQPGTAVAEATGNAAGSMAGIVGSRALGMGITAAAPLTGPLAPATALLGQAIAWFGPAAMAALPSYGGIRDKQILNDPANEADWKSKAIASLGAATVGAIETKFGPQQWALSALTREGRAALAEKFAETTLAKGIGFGALKGAAIEGAEELAQNPIEQAASFDDPTTRDSLADTAFGGAMGAIGGGVLGGATGGIIGRRVDAKPQAEEKPPEPAPTLQLGNTPDPIVVFPDGTAGRRADLEAYINGLPEEQRIAARAKLMGMGQRDVTPADILAATSADDAIAKFTAASITGSDLGGMLGQENPLIGASRDLQAQAAADEADLADLAQSEARDLNTLRALTAEDARKQQELDALQAAGTGQFGIRPEERTAVEQAATIEAPSIMQLAMQRARDRGELPNASAPDRQAPATPGAVVGAQWTGGGPAPVARPELGPDVSGMGQGDGAASAESAGQPAAVVRQPDILPGDIARLDGKPFQTENGARLKQREAGGTDGSEIVQVQGGYVVRPKAAAADAVAATPVQAPGVQPATGGVPAAVVPPQPVNQPLNQESVSAQAPEAQQVPSSGQEPAAGAASVDARVPDPAVPAEGGAVPAQAQDQRLIPVSKRAPPEQTDLTDDETAAEFERLYQEDIKADIRRRLGLESPEKAEKQAPSRFRTFLRKHGIKPQYAPDITGDRGFRANNMLPATFRRNGLGIDELAIRALEEGYLTQAEFDSEGDIGGTNRLMEMIQAELRGKRQDSNVDADEGAEAELERVRRMELEDMAQSLGLPFDADMDAAALAGMVARVQRALDKSREPKGSTKAERVRQNAIAAAKRIEAKRQKYERELEEFAKADAVEQNAFLEVLMDDDGTPVVSRLADLEAEEAWNATLGTWSDQNGQSTRAEVAPARQAEAPDAQAAGQRPGDAQEGDSGQQRRSDQGQEEGLTAPTRAIREPEAPYETDLFGNPVPAPAGTPGRTGPDQAGLRGNVQRTAGVRDTPAPAGEYFVNTLVSTETQRELGTAKVLTPEHAAQATAYLYKSAVERLDGIVTDKNGNVLAVVGGFKGALAQASVYPATIVAEAVRIPGAARIWFSHNHPSGSAALSRADENLEGTLSRVFQGSGIEPMGLLAVAGERFAYIRSGGGTPDGYTGDIPATVTRKKVPVYERELGGKNVAADVVTSPSAAKSIGKAFYARQKGAGLMLLDSQNRLAAWVPITPEMMQPLKGGALNAIYRAISQSNAGAVVFVHGGELDASPQSLYGQSIGKNIGAAMAQIDVRVLDSVNAVTGKSAAERGESLVGAALFARGNPFYSALSREVERIPAKAQGGMGWLMNITGLVKAGKVKADEVEWSGLTDWLKMQQGKVTREQVLEYLAGNGVQVTETVLGEGGNKGIAYYSEDERWGAEPAEFGSRAEAIDAAMGMFDMNRGEAEQFVSETDETFAAPATDTSSDTKYGQYQLPGGTNYREVLLTLPVKSKDAWVDAAGNVRMWIDSEPSAVEASALERSGLRRKTIKVDESAENFQGPHWDQPNVLAHIRLNDRVDSDGKRVLFVEEIQSDYAQERRKNLKMAAESGSQMVREGADKKTPPAPFIDKTDAWVALALKRIIKMAVDEGYDRVAFINGEQSAERYDLSKQVKAVRYTRDFETGKYEISFQPVNANRFEGAGQFDADKLPNVVGKDLAKKIVEQAEAASKRVPDADVSGRIDGLDLKVGGEGMRAFYDQIVLSAASDVLRRLGVRQHAPGGEAVAAQVDRNGGLVDAQAIRDLTLSQPFKNKGFKGLAPDAKRLVQAHMLALGKNDQVLKSVVRAVPVDVVNVLRAKQLSPEMFFHDPTMLVDGLSAKLGADVATRIDVPTSLVLAAASVAAEPGAVRPAAGGPAGNERGGTVGTGFHKGIIQQIDLPGIGPQPGFDITPAMQEKAANGLPLFARNKPGRGVRIDDANAVVAAVREALPTAPPIHIMESVAQAPEKLRDEIKAQGAENDVDAAYHDGEIYVFPANIPGIERMQFVLAHHEIRHHGLRTMLGSRMNATMLKIHESNPTIRALAAEQVRKGFAKSRILATEEALADMPVADLVKLNGWDRIVAAVREWLRGAAARLRKAGLTGVADAIDAKEWTDKDVAALIARAEGVSRGGSARYATEGTVFGTDDGGALVPATTSPASSVAVRNLNAIMRDAGWEIEYVDLDLTAEKPKAAIRVNRNDGRFLIAKVDAQGRASFETFQRELSLRMDPGQKGRRPLSPMVDDMFLGRQRFEGARAMLRGMTNYLADNALNPIALADMRSAWAGVMAGPVKQDTALPAPTSDGALMARSDQTSTPAFKKWFSGSKVVDKDGLPLRVFHGTHRDFSAFDAKAPSSHIPLPGFYFTPDPDIASTFAENGAKMAENKAGRPFAPIGSNVMPAYLSIQNPLDVDVAAGGMKGFVSEKVIKDVILEAKRLGHDGVILRGWADGSGPVQYIAFDPAQVKSAIGNNGSFDPTNPDIRFARSESNDAYSVLEDPSAEEAAAVQSGIEGKSAAQAADFIANNATDESHRLIATKVAKRLRQLEAVGSKFTLHVAHDGDQVPSTMIGAGIRGQVIQKPGDPETHIWIQGADMKDKVGVSYETVLHELLHAATQKAIDLGEYGAQGEIGLAVRGLYKVTEHVQQHLRDKLKSGDALSDFEQTVVRMQNNSMANLHEMVTWALTNKETQKYLESIPYKSGSLWSEFVAAVRRFLGLNASADTALSEVLQVADKLLSIDAGRLLAESITQGVHMQANYPGRRGVVNSARSAVTGRALPQTWQAPDPTRMDDLLYSMQDKHIDTKRVVTAVRDAIGGIADNLDPYLQEELYHGRAAMATKEFLEKSIRPLLTDMQARGVEMSDFEEYLHNRHAERRNVQVAKVNPGMPDGGSGIKTAAARAYLAGLPAAKRTAFQALAKRVDKINRDTRALLVSSGLEKQSTINAWEAAYGDEYVPLMREEMDNGTTGIGQGYSVRGSASKRAMGSNKPVANILANIALQREKAITRSEKRRIGEALYGMVLTAPNPDFWFAVDPALEQNPAQITATSMQLISMGMNPADAQSIAAEPRQRYIDPRTNQVAERINPALRGADNVLAVRVDGEDKYVFFNAKDPRAMRMVQALKNLDSDQLGVVMGNAAKMTRYFASINTQFNPIFGVVNLTRDIQTALLNLQSTRLAGKQAEVMKHVGSALRGIYIDLRDHRAGKQPTSSWANLFEEFQREGGATGYRDMYANAQERADAITDELKRIKQGRAMEVGRGIFGWLSDYNESMENAVRLATYKVAKEQGMSNQQAASLAKNLTVNFNRKGQVALQAGALYAFFNASVQGTARMAETMFAGKKLSGIGKKIITGGLLLGSMQALLLAAAGYDDEEPPDFVRERALVFPIGGDKYVSIPMPLGFHVIPNLARIPTEWALGGFRDTPKRLGQLVGLFFDAFNPIGSAGVSLQTITPTIIDPLAALAENRDWTGKPIAKKDFNSMQPTAGHTRAKDTATPWARMISYGINIATGGTDYKPGLASPTPDQIDYLIGQATGGVGREVSKLSQVGSSAVSGEELPLYKIPLLGRFVGTTAGQAAESGRFYENLKEIGEHDAELTGLKKDRRMAEYREYLRDNPDARMVPAAERAHREVSKLMRMKRDAIRDGASQERVRMLDQQITARMRAFNARVREMEPAT